MVLTAHLFWYKVGLLLYLERLSYLVVIHTLDRERKYKNKPNLGGEAEQSAGLLSSLSFLSS